MNRKLIAVLIANLFIAPAALAQGDFKWEGNVGLGGIVTDDKDTRDRAKLEEYQTCQTVRPDISESEDAATIPT